MPNKVQIEVTLDDSDVQAGMQRVNRQFDVLAGGAQRATKTGTDGFSRMRQEQERSVGAMRLANQYLGIQLPRTMVQWISQNQAAASVLNSAFNLTLLAGFGAAVVALLPKVADLADAAAGFSSEMKQAYENAKKANLDALSSPVTAEIGRQNLRSINQQLEARKKFIDTYNEEIALNQDLTGFGAQLNEEDEKNLQLQQKRIELLPKQAGLEAARGAAILRAQAEANAAGLQGYAALAQQHGSALDALRNGLATMQIGQGAYDSLVASESKRYSGVAGALAEQNADATRKLRDQVVQAWLDGDDQILAKERATYAELDDMVKHTLLTSKEAEAQRVLYHQQAADQILKLGIKEAQARGEAERSALALVRTAAAGAQAESLRGFAAIDAATQAQMKQLGEAFEKATQGITGPALSNLQDELTSVYTKIIENAEEKKNLILQRAALDTVQIEEQAALAIAPPWERAYASIYIDAVDRVQAIDQTLGRHVETQELAARQVQAVWQEAAGKVQDEWRNAFEELFSGGVAQYLKKRATEFAADLATRLTLRSGASSFLGPLLGLPAGVPGAVSATNVGFGQTSFGAGTAGLGTLLPALAGAGGLAIPGVTTGTFGAGTGLSAFPALAGAPALGQFGGGTNATGYNISAVDQLLGISGASSIKVTTAKTGAGLLNSGALAGALPLISALLGGKVGGTAGTLGAGILGTMALGAFTNVPLISGLMGTAGGALLAGLGGGLLGFGIGQQHGALAGSLSGALTGLLIGGPIGGIIGLLGGLFGGLFGGSKRRQQAEAYASQQAAEIDKVVASFKGFQIDYASATSQLQQMRSDAQQQLGQLKKEGNQAYQNILAPKFDNALKELDTVNHERERRMGLVFGPPEFSSGGYTGNVPWAGGWGLPPGAAGIVHPGEYVSDPQTTQQFLPQLEMMSRGVAPGGGEIHLHFHTIDGPSTKRWLNNGGGVEAIMDAVRRGQQEGRW